MRRNRWHEHGEPVGGGGDAGVSAAERAAGVGVGGEERLSGEKQSPGKPGMVTLGSDAVCAVVCRSGSRGWVGGSVCGEV